GHYGLNLPAYIHLTSPIRRYADLLNQHILLAALKGEPPPYPKEQLAEIAEHINGAEDDMKDAKSAHFLAAYDKEIRKTVVEAAQEPSASPLADLGTKKFHSVIRMAAASDALSPAIEQEILRRLEQQMLYANDIFTLVFRYQNKGEAWEKVRRAALEEIQRQPYLAISILLMGHQSLGWGTPHYEVRPSGVNHRMLFKASVKVTAAEQQYASSQQVATQKELAKQLASAEVLAKIAGIELPSLSSHETSTEVTPPSSEASRDVKLQNYKGQLQELAQSRKWDLPSYTEVARTGPPHAPVFTVEGKITIDGREHTVRCIGNSKTEAEQLAAQQLLQLVPDLPSTAATNALSGGKNPVSVLNEMKQKLELSDVTYTYEQHDITSDQEFTCICSVMTSDDQTIEMAGTGQTKKDATRRAASRALAFLLTGDPEN
ncbi:MAG: RNB domain-containing ribonuclease, partial [Ktedonobacteraceae bacterium]|nr:RNB domain-containing ribonuclease [Ktedonobacteraceae bacterium]